MGNICKPCRQKEEEQEKEEPKGITVFYTDLNSDRKFRSDSFRLHHLLEAKGVRHQKVNIRLVPKKFAQECRKFIIYTKGSYVLPAVYKGDIYIGSYEDLQQLEDYGELDSLLNNRV